MFAPRTLPGFIPPCLPIKAPPPPTGDICLHEIKHDGFRLIARKHGERVRLYSRPGDDLTQRFPLLADALAQLRAASCIIDGEAVAVGPDGIPSFDRLRYRRRDASVILFAFDLIEFNGEDLRHTPIEQRKTALAKLLSRAGPRIQLNEHIEEDGALSLNMHACSDLRASYRSARAPPTVLDGHRIGSRARTRSRRQSGARPKRIGGGDSLRPHHQLGAPGQRGKHASDLRFQSRAPADIEPTGGQDCTGVG